VSGIPVTELVAEDKLNAIIERTKSGGGELVNLMGTSAWYAPGAAAAQMAVSILKNENRIYPCCVLLKGEYQLDNLFVGAPVKLGRDGIQTIIELQLNTAELELLHKSAAAVREVVDVLNNMNLA
jgi:malate dehydrogenase